MTDPNDYFFFAQNQLVYAVDELPKAEVSKFYALICDKRSQGWSPEMIEIHLMTNISHKIKQQYPKLRRRECEVISEEMIQAMLERIIRENIKPQ